MILRDIKFAEILVMHFGFKYHPIRAGLLDPSGNHIYIYDNFAIVYQ